MATEVILQTYRPTYRPDALTLSVAYQLGKDGGYACWQDAIEEAERILELEGEPIEFPATFAMAEEA
jgi:hypothetical protein